MKKMFILFILCLVLSQNIYASEVLNIIEENNNLKFVYEVNKEEKDLFIESLEQNINYEDKNYKLVDYSLEEQNYIDTIEINDIKEVTANSNTLEEILDILPKTISYDKDGYVGKNELDYESIEVTPICNGYYEEFIDEIKQYFDLSKNDMDFIPKEIEKDGYTLYLVNVEWHTQTTKNIGEFKISDLYRGEAFYRGVKKIYNPYTYKVVAKYNGTAQKEIEKPYLIKANYEEAIPTFEEKKDNNIALPVLVVGGSSGIFIVLMIFYFNKRVKIYCNNKYVGSYKIRGNEINITRLINKTDNTTYTLKLNKMLYKKYKWKSLRVVKGILSKYCQVTSDNIEVKF